MTAFRRLSAPGSSALSIWELRANREELEKVFPNSLPTMGTPLRLDRRSLPFDEALLWARGDPTASDDLQVLECHLHGGHGVASAFRHWLQGFGWEELTESAAGSEDLLLHANSPLAARVAMPMQGGGFRRALEGIQALAPAARKQALQEIVRWDSWAEVLSTPPILLLAGPPNSGKSSLFNLWNQAELVTIHEGAGTTRDPVQARILIGEGEDQAMFRLVDSAGIGDGQEHLDRQAMDLTLSQLARAWQVLWVLDAAFPPSPTLLGLLQRRNARDHVLLHRSDLSSGWSPEQEGIQPDLVGHVQEGRAWIQRIETAILSSLGSPPPPGALVALEEGQRREVEKLLRDLD
ncbi:MAG: GTPase [Planctomycetota bacterium]|jgi:hypothetical protein